MEFSFRCEYTSRIQGVAISLTLNGNRDLRPLDLPDVSEPFVRI